MARAPLRPRIAVDTAEQRPWSFGYVPSPWQREGERGPVHEGEVDESSLVNTMLAGPWESERRNLNEGDYQLIAPDGHVIDRLFACERKSMVDLRGSLSAGHDRLMAEMERLAPYRFPCMIVEGPVETLLGSQSGLVLAIDGAAEMLQGSEFDNLARALWLVIGEQPEERARPGRVTPQSLVGVTLSILSDYRIPCLFLPNRAWAEYACAWLARRAYGRWLKEQGERGSAETMGCV